MSESHITSEHLRAAHAPHVTSEQPRVVVRVQDRPWIWCRRGRVFVELFANDDAAIHPERHELTADELRWLDEVALPELRAEEREMEERPRKLERPAKASCRRV